MTRIDATARFFIILAASVGPASIDSVRAASEASTRLRNFGGPDAFGYQFIDSLHADGPDFATEWEDISATGTAITFTAYGSFGATDEGEMQLPLGFSFPYYGNTYTDCWVNTNAFVKFGSSTINGATAYVNSTVPTVGGDDNKICVKWRDWLNVTGRYQGFGSAPDRRMVVTWLEGTDSVELKLYENGNFVVLIESIGANTDGTIGTENDGATAGLLYSFNRSPLPMTNSLAIQFLAGPAPTVNLGDPTPAQFDFDGTTSVAVGGSVSITTAVCSATLANGSGDARRVQVEARLTSQGFTGTPTHTGASAAGDVLTVLLSNLRHGSYHWRARVFEPASGFLSDWIGFGANDNPMDPTDPNGATDFEVPIGVGGPDAFGYTFKDDRAVNGPVYNSELEDLSVIGTPITWVAYDTFPADDEGEALLSLGLSFSFYGNTYTDCYVNTNGFVKFGSPTFLGTEAYAYETMPTAGGQDNIIAVKWTEWANTIGRYAVLGTAPDRRFVVTWSRNGGQEFGQLKLFENGTMVVMTSSSNSNGTVGIENSTGSSGLLYAYNNQPNPVTGRTVAIQFVPAVLTVPTPPPPPSGGGGSSGRCGSVGLDLMAPLGLLFVWRQLKRKERRTFPG